VLGHLHRLIAFTILAPALEAAPHRSCQIVTKHQCGTLPSLLLALATIAFLNTCSHTNVKKKKKVRQQARCAAQTTSQILLYLSAAPAAAQAGSAVIDAAAAATAAAK
jgi:hypothetical protein